MQLHAKKKPEKKKYNKNKNNNNNKKGCEPSYLCDAGAVL